MKRSAKGYNGTTAMSRQSPDVTNLMQNDIIIEVVNVNGLSPE
jgi:hypothetical protein